MSKRIKVARWRDPEISTKPWERHGFCGGSVATLPCCTSKWVYVIWCIELLKRRRFLFIYAQHGTVHRVSGWMINPESQQPSLVDLEEPKLWHIHQILRAKPGFESSSNSPLLKTNPIRHKALGHGPKASLSPGSNINSGPNLTYIGICYSEFLIVFSWEKNFFYEFFFLFSKTEMVERGDSSQQFFWMWP